MFSNHKGSQGIVVLERVECASCGAGIGPEFEHKYQEHAGDKTLCGFCKGIMITNGFIQLDDYKRMMPDGSIIKARRELKWSWGKPKR